MSIEFRAGHPPLIAGLIALMLATGPAATTAVGQTSPAYAEAERRMLARPADAEAAFQFARVASGEGNFRAAIAALERVLVLNPGLSNIRLELGVLYLRVGSTRLAEEFIAEAVKAPDIPPDVKARAEELLDLAQDANRPLRFSGSAFAGLVSDSNANAGPAGGVQPQDTGQADISADLRLSGELSYDLGTQAGHRLVARFGYLNRTYSEQSQVDIDRFALSLGGEFNLAPGGPVPRVLRLSLDASYYDRGNEKFLTEAGPRLSYATAIGPRTQAEVSLFANNQNFHNTTRVTVNDERDGEYRGAALTLLHRLDDRSELRFGLGLAQKDATVGYESYSDTNLSLTYSIVHKPLFGNSDRNWRSSVNASVGTRRYDAPDLAAGFTEDQSSRSYLLSGSVEIPLRDRLSLLTEIGVNGNASNYDINDFKNTFVSIGVATTF